MNLFHCIELMCLMVWFLVYECNSSTSSKVFRLCLFSPLSSPSLSSSGCGAAHPDRPPPLQRAAAAGQCHTGVSVQRGLPLSLEAGLEGGGQQQLLRGVTRRGGPGEGRPLQPEQHPEPLCRPVEEGGLSELWGQSEWTDPCHSNPGPWPLLRVELQQHFLSGNDASFSLLEILMKLQIFSVQLFLQVSHLSTHCFNVHVAF